MRGAPALAIALLLCASCGNHEAESRATDLAETIRAEQVEHFVRTFAVSAPTRAVERAEAAAHTPSIRALVEQGRLDFEPDPVVRELVTLLFAERDYEHLFVYGTQLTPDGRAVASVLENAHLEGLDPANLHAELTASKRSDLQAAGNVGDLISRLQLSVEDEAQLLAFMMNNAAVDGTLPAADAVFNAIASPGTTNPLPDYAAAIDELTERMEEAQMTGPELELVLAAGFVRYAIANRHANLGYVDEATAAAQGWDIEDPNQRDDIVRTLAGESFRRGVEEGFAAVLSELQPPFEQYERLAAGAREYAGYVEAGGWDPIPLDPDDVLRRGDTGDAVRALRARLAAENYFDGDVTSGQFDGAVEEAVRAYQRSHQLNVDGEVSGSTLYSMNISAERRLAQIFVGLDFWRETQRAHDFAGEHIWVNVPDFHGELWDNGALVYRWRVVVGREGGGIDSVTGEVRGRTPSFSDDLQYIVFNPYWNVPDQIRREEYDHLIEADPKWLVMNGFELAFQDGREWLRQLPGPGNALGRVKFLFPNQHDVYMHDTPSRSLFDRPTRAYSHGCVRVHEPMELARLLIERDRGWTSARTDRYIDQLMEAGTEQWLTLQTSVPIHLEYVSVRGGDDGRVEFLADPYRLTRPKVDAVYERVFGPSEDAAN